MAEPISKVRGMHDYVGDDYARMHLVLEVFHQQAELFGYRPIVTPILEKADLFCRTAGDSSDVVMKEMYRFTDQGGEDLALRPEGTASVMRAIISEGLTQDLPQKLCYAGAMFRRERPQKGRLRQFHQCAVEYIGTRSAFADAEVIICGAKILQILGIKTRLEINSLGGSESRGQWRDALRTYFSAHQDKLSAASIERITRNPLRILDSKDEGDRQIINNAPPFAEFITEEEQEFYAKVKNYVAEAGIEMHENPALVRGLDYYNDTAFEFISDEIGAQGTVLAGGRYDGLSAMIGGAKNMPSVGWAAGIERLMLLAALQTHKKLSVAIIAMGDEYLAETMPYADALRDAGLVTHVIPHGNMKQKLTRANNLAVDYALIYGENEQQQQKLTLKNMQSGAEEMLTIDAIIATRLLHSLKGKFDV